MTSIFDESCKGIHKLDPDDFGAILARAADEADGEPIGVDHLLAALVRGDDETLINTLAEPGMRGGAG